MKNIKYSLDINKYEGCIFIKDTVTKNSENSEVVFLD